MSLREVTVKIAANSSDEFPFKGNYIRAKIAPYAVTIENIESGGRDIFNLDAGEDALFSSDFERLRISNTGAVDSLFTFVIGKDAKQSSAKISGSLTVNAINSQMPPQAAGLNSQKTVTNTAAQMLAQNLARQYLLIQNNDAAGDIYIAFGVTATLTNGLKIKAGQSYELNSNILTAAVSAIGSIASNANIVVIEG